MEEHSVPTEHNRLPLCNGPIAVQESSNRSLRPPAALSKAQMKRTQPLGDPVNARLRALLAEMDDDALARLWLPPTVPYVQQQGGGGASKTLVFTSWAAAPTAIAAAVNLSVEPAPRRGRITQQEEPARALLEPTPSQVDLPPGRTAGAPGRRSRMRPAAHLPLRRAAIDPWGSHGECAGCAHWEWAASIARQAPCGPPACRCGVAARRGSPVVPST